MKVYNDIVELKSKELSSFLNNYRNNRRFDVSFYLDQKIEKLRKYYTESNLDSAVVAISGGIDSAITLAIMVEFKKRYPELLKNILAITLPATENSGVVNQNELLEKVSDLSINLNIDIKKFDLSRIADITNKETEKLFNVNIEDWAKGQYIPYLRTSYLYYLTSIMSQEGNRSIIIGTINADEGQYLGYIGKASDAMVDIQLISDIHKREVYMIGEYFNLPTSIMNATPTGDMFDHRVDEEVFGTSYDAVELYYAYLKLDEKEQDFFINSLSQSAKLNFEKIQFNLENLHKYNFHKYLGCSPAIHFDVFDMKIQGGWKYFNI